MTLLAEDNELLKIADHLYPVLRDFPADGQLRTVDQGTMMGLTLAGFIERKEVTKPCKTCGTPKFDYGYFRITGGGKLFMAMSEAALRTRSTQEGDKG